MGSSDAYEPDAVGWLLAAGGPGLDEHAVADITHARKSLGILKPVIAAEAADGLAFLLDECQRRMAFDGVPQFLEFAVYRLFAKGRLEGCRVQEDVDIFREPPQ